MRRISASQITPVHGAAPTGPEEALSLMEQLVIGGAVSPKTNEVILKQISDSEKAQVRDGDNRPNRPHAGTQHNGRIDSGFAGISTR